MTRMSVVIPVLDDAPMLEVCLRTLHEQTRRPDEIIVVDNGSVDNSAAIAHAAGARVVREDRPGITAAAARGFDEATGEIIARCDADSQLPPNWLERIEMTLAANPDAVAITGPGRFYDLTATANRFAQVLYVNAYFMSMRAALGNNVLFGSNCAVRRSQWLQMSASVPRDDTELHDDMDLSFRVHPAARVIHDRDLIVGISGRPFRSLSGARRRMRRAIHTIGLHWPTQSPRRRWKARLKGRPSDSNPSHPLPR
ncbi:MAG TPA: glycosyltransferase family 2 protein [Glaciihabitans sp.]|nr:glycosyltransferase family 2 protein [Glaciihabitans sp.]